MSTVVVLEQPPLLDHRDAVRRDPDLDVGVTDELSEEDATPMSVSEHVHRLLGAREPAVLCTHRPVLPWVFEALGLEERRLDLAGMLVVHHRKNRVVATERH